MFSLTLTKVLLTSLGCGLAVKQVAYGGVFLIRTPSSDFLFFNSNVPYRVLYTFDSVLDWILSCIQVSLLHFR